VVVAANVNFGRTAFAIENVVAKLVNAKSARWETVIDLGSLGKHTSRTAIMPGRTRQEDEDGSVMIIDWKSGQALSLSPDSKTAMRMEMGLDFEELEEFKFLNQFQTLRDSLGSSLESDGLNNVESLGSKIIDGRKLTGYRFDGQEKITIWADPKTEVAVQIELTIGADVHFVMKNYNADVPVDETLFSLEIPDGYQVMEVDLPTGMPSEAEFIRTLKLSCECCDGMFPPALDIISTSTVSADIQVHLIKSMEIDPTGATGNQIAELTRATMGFAFATKMLVSNERDAHYAGANVKLGTTDRPIFWYQPEGSDQYRIIFADLTVQPAASAPIVDGAVRLSL